MAITRNSGRAAKRVAIKKINSRKNGPWTTTAVASVSGIEKDKKRKTRYILSQKKPDKLTYKKLTMDVMEDALHFNSSSSPVGRRTYNNFYSIPKIQTQVHQKFPQMVLNDSAIRKAVLSLHAEGLLLSPRKKKMTFRKRVTINKHKISSTASFSSSNSPRVKRKRANVSRPTNDTDTPTRTARNNSRAATVTPDSTIGGNNNNINPAVISTAVTPVTTAASSPSVDSSSIIEVAGLPSGCIIHMPYNIHLNLTDTSRNMNKFMRLQVVVDNSNNEYYFINQWGRNHTQGQCSLHGPWDCDRAVAAMEKKFQQKTGTSWSDRHNAASGNGDSSARGGHGLYGVVVQRLQKAGASMSTTKGSVAVSLIWDHARADKRNDLDLWVTAPSGERIGYSHKKSSCGGELDVDRYQCATEPIENIVWKSRAPVGEYRVQVHNYSSNHQGTVPFTVMIVLDGKQEKHEMIKKLMPADVKAWVDVKTFKYGV